MGKRKQTNLIVVHCSATPPEMDIGVDKIDEWHRARGWSGCGYHIIIRRDGTVEYGRHMDDIGAHCKGHNIESVGICMVGGVSGVNGKAENNFTAAQFESLQFVLAVAVKSYPTAQIVGHRDLSPDVDGDGVVEPHEWMKDCPSFDVGAWLQNITGVISE